VLPPLGFAATLPVSSHRCAQSTTVIAFSHLTPRRKPA
jgi:hypothetical protein